MEDIKNSLTFGGGNYNVWDFLKDTKVFNRRLDKAEKMISGFEHIKIETIQKERE